MRNYRVILTLRTRTVCAGTICETPGKGFKFYPADEHLRPSRVFHPTPEAALVDRVSGHSWLQADDTAR